MFLAYKAMAYEFKKIFPERYIFKFWKINKLGETEQKISTLIFDASGKSGKKKLEKIVSQIFGEGVEITNNDIESLYVARRICYISSEKGVYNIDIAPHSVPFGTHEANINNVRISPNKEDSEGFLIEIDIGILGHDLNAEGTIHLKLSTHDKNLEKREISRKLYLNLLDCLKVECLKNTEEIRDTTFLVVIKTPFHEHGGIENVLCFQEYFE